MHYRIAGVRIILFVVFDFISYDHRRITVILLVNLVRFSCCLCECKLTVYLTTHSFNSSILIVYFLYCIYSMLLLMTDTLCRNVLYRYRIM